MSRGDDDKRPPLTPVGSDEFAEQKANDALQEFTRSVGRAQQQAPQVATDERRDLAALHKVRAMHVAANRELAVRAGWGAIAGVGLFGLWWFLFGRGRA